MAAAATGAAALIGIILSGGLPMPPGISPGVTVAGDPAGAVSTPISVSKGSPPSRRPSPVGARPTSGRTTSSPTTAAPTALPSGSASTSPGPSATPSASLSAPVLVTVSVSASGSAPVSASASVSAAQAQVLALVNTAREQNGCGALTASPALTTLAQSFSQEMSDLNFFSHTDPDGRSPWDRAGALGITNLGGENIARGQQTPDAVMAAWLSSPGHRANILDCDYHSLGVGVFYGPNGPWWTQDFGF